MSQKFEYFGKYILLEKLAAGGMAEVFLSRAPGAGGIGKFVALKRILPQFSDNPEYIDMFKSEAKIAVNLSNSNVVNITEFGIESSQFFLVMEYVEGRNLRQILNKIKKEKVGLSIEQIVYIIKEVAGGLDHAHRCLDGTTGKPLNIIHRDMSPQNVMVSFEGQVKIIDFGIAKAETQSENTKAGTLKGKYGYMSPEQAEGQVVDLRTDIFSLGIVLWELLANDRLFIANNEINTLRKIRDCQVPSLKKINPNIHPELERIAQKALARDRNLRYQYAAALHRDLSRFLNRQYPDFSPHDFAVNIKSLFADDILNLRKRLVEYSKIPFPDINGNQVPLPEDTSANNAASGTQKQGQSTSNFYNKTESKMDDDDSNTKEPTFTFTNTDLDDEDEKSVSVTVKNKSASAAKNPSVLDESVISRNITTEFENTDPSVRAKKMDELKNRIAKSQANEQVSVDSYSQTGKFDRSNIVKKSRRKRRKDMRIKRTIKVAAVPLLLVTMAASLFWAFDSGLIQRWIAPPEYGGKEPTPPACVPGTEGCVGLGSQSDPNAVVIAPLIINSDPSGAEIFIDGKNTDKVTPARIDTFKGKPFNLTLRKELYVDYIKEGLIVDKTRVYAATLEKMSVGYIDIDVKPPMNAKIQINGRTIEGKLPINRRIVQANKTLTIRAENPFNNTYAQRTVILKENEQRAIILQLRKKKPKRKPTYRK